jgi:hypothetical protein
VVSVPSHVNDTGQGLHIDTPLGGIESEHFQRTFLTQQFRLVDKFVSSVVTCTGVAFGIFILHMRPESIHDGQGSKVLQSDRAKNWRKNLGGNEDDRFFLSLHLICEDTSDLRIGLVQRLLQNLCNHVSLKCFEVGRAGERTTRIEVRMRIRAYLHDWGNSSKFSGRRSKGSRGRFAEEVAGTQSAGEHPTF